MTIMNIIISAIILFLICLTLNGFIVRYKHIHEYLNQSSSQNPQNVHIGYIPRIGGVTIFIGFVLNWLFQYLTFSESVNWPSQWLLVLPLFLAGLTEDITHRVDIKFRFLAALFTGVLMFYLYPCQIIRIDISWIDNHILTVQLASLMFTTIAIAGLANGYNLIDGLNGLASMVAMISLLAILYVAFKVGDIHILRTSLMMIVTLQAFFFFNYPKGLLFLGDGGAYLVGFVIAVNSILLVEHHEEVSAWFALLVNAYPITETLFTIWRRFFHRHGSPAVPDALHFHSLLYRRALKWAMPFKGVPNGGYLANAQTSPFLWGLSSLGVIPAILFWNKPYLCQLSTVLFILIYISLYLRIVRFKKPSFLTSNINKK